MPLTPTFPYQFPKLRCWKIASPLWVCSPWEKPGLATPPLLAWESHSSRPVVLLSIPEFEIALPFKTYKGSNGKEIVVHPLARIVDLVGE